MIARIYLTIVGLMYIALAVWCTFQPEKTSGKVGFELVGGSGRSEFMTVYGGLELGLGLAFLLPLLRAELTSPLLLTCLIVHLSLVTFRTLSLYRFSGFQSITFTLYTCEWLLLISSALIYWRFNSPPTVAG